MVDRTKCPICWIEADKSTPRGKGVAMRSVGDDVYEVECLRCGVFRMTEEEWHAQRSEDDRKKISWYVRARFERELPTPVLCLEPTSGRIPNSVTFADIEAAFPKSIVQLHDEFLVTIEHMGRYGQSLSLHHGLDESLVGAFEKGDLSYHTRQLEQEGLVVRSPSTSSVQVVLTKDGWTRIEYLTRGRSAKPRQAFIAMWFPDEDDPWSGHLTAAWESGFAEAARATGYDPLRIDRKEHNNKICDEIVAEIRKSGLLIADFTGNRGGVYFEAGFAVGLDKPVIWTCNKEWHDEHKIHFDTRQYNHILWRDADDLFAQLRSRIEATAPLS